MGLSPFEYIADRQKQTLMEEPFAVLVFEPYRQTATCKKHRTEPLFARRRVTVENKYSQITANQRGKWIHKNYMRINCFVNSQNSHYPNRKSR